jgi:hypothetical protein
MSKGWHILLFIKIFLFLILFFILGCTFLISGCTRNSQKPISHPLQSNNFSKQHELIDFFDNFNDPNLNHESWEITRQGDFRISMIDIFDVGPEAKRDYRLRLRADTINTRDDTVKYHGVRCRYQIDFTISKRISVDLDWNNQANGCYLTAAIYICPTITSRNPQDEENWLRFEYIGVPPGENARCAISTKINNRVRHLYTEGWPENRQGRFIAYQKIDIFIDDQGFEILENGKNLYGLKPHGLDFSSGYLYLQMSSHSNYPAREIYFDNIIIQPDFERIKIQ